MFSQTSGLAKYKIKLAEDHFYFDGDLLFNQTTSLFIFKQRDQDRWIVEDGDFGPMQIIYTDTIGHRIWRNISSDKLVIRSFCGLKSSLVYEDIFHLNWDLSNNEMRTISGIECRMATTTFRGRKYEALYAPSIPVSTGPWKFYGLPGLIFNISDSKKEINIYLTEVLYPSLAQLDESSLSINASMEEYYNCLDNEWDRYYETTQANIAQLQAKYPDLEISDNNLPKNRPATELEFE